MAKKFLNLPRISKLLNLLNDTLASAADVAEAEAITEEYLEDIRDISIFDDYAQVQDISQIYYNGITFNNLKNCFVLQCNINSLYTCANTYVITVNNKVYTPSRGNTPTSPIWIASETLEDGTTSINCIMALCEYIAEEDAYRCVTEVTEDSVFIIFGPLGASDAQEKQYEIRVSYNALELLAFNTAELVSQEATE